MGNISKCYILGFLISGCVKESNQMDVLLRVIHNSKAVEQAVVYVEDGATSNPTMGLLNYTRKYGTDAVGEAYLTLPVNDYYIVATGYPTPLRKYVTGSILLRLNKGN
jgi:hypothetical protein